MIPDTKVHCWLHSSVGVSIYINNLIRIRKTNPTRKGAKKKCGYQTRPGKNNITITGFIGCSLEGKYIFHRNREGMEKLTLYWCMYVYVPPIILISFQLQIEKKQQRLKQQRQRQSRHSNPSPVVAIQWAILGIIIAILTNQCERIWSEYFQMVKINYIPFVMEQ